VFAALSSRADLQAVQRADSALNLRTSSLCALNGGVADPVDIQKTYKILCVPLWEYSLSG
jgi:hypothetical protein